MGRSYYIDSSGNKQWLSATVPVVNTYTTCVLPAFTEAGSKTVNVPGVTGDSTPILSVVPSTDAAEAAEQYKSWSKIYAAKSDNGKIIFYSNGATSQITVAVKGY